MSSRPNSALDCPALRSSKERPRGAAGGYAVVIGRVPMRPLRMEPAVTRCGLLRGGFRPVEQVCALRSLVRDKATLWPNGASRFVGCGRVSTR